MEKYKSDAYKSKDSRRLLHDLYREHLLAMNVPVAERMVETRFGDTHVVFYGHPDGKPVLTLYGEYAINPLAIRPLAHGLNLEKIRLIVPDPLGTVGFSAEKRISSFKNYGEWACQIMNALGLPDAAVLGYSFGAGIALQLCITSLLRVERLLLVMPSGIRSVSSSRVAKLIYPAFKNEQLVTDTMVKKALNPILPFQQDELIEAAKMIFLHAKIRKEGQKRVKKKSIRKYKSPVYVIAEKSDYLFPGEAVLKRAGKIIPCMPGSKLLAMGSHCGLYKDNDENVEEYFRAMSDFLLQQ
ncbi:MAG: alpha/beta hydrolase [Tannerella sp.]|jgi:pimeloyl-ACP methyl ester carboxylesterase|nr:alpha/beta hydrolase [Tannerella sp.]